MTDSPLVSICIPTYNRAGIIRETIESALAQSYPNIEVLVVDNASTDNTPDVIRGFSDPRLTFYPNSENTGIFGNFNRCIALARGEFVHILHSDDCIDPGFIETCIAFFAAHPEVSLTFTSARFVTDTPGSASYTLPADRIFLPPEGFREILTQKISIICPSVIVRKDVYRDLGAFSPEFPYAADYYQWLRISQKYALGYVRDAWISYRIGNHSETYAYLFKNPLGYLDVLKIYVQLKKDLGEKEAEYRSELNTEIYQFVKNLLSAGFLRSDRMTIVGPSFFAGLAMSALAMIRPSGIAGSVKKAGYFVLVMISGVLLPFSPFRALARLILARKDGSGY